MDTPTVKTCSKCNIEKLVSEFYINRKRNQPQHYCKECVKSAGLIRNKEKSLVTKEKNDRILKEALDHGMKFCTMCNIEKKFCDFPKNMIGKYKLDARCRNCHKDIKASRSRIYRIWECMRQRCNNKNNQAYHRYGGRGIKICREWDDYRKFRDWALVNGYNDLLTIERNNNDGNYEPSNCSWVTMRVQAANRHTTLMTVIKAQEARKMHSSGNFLQKDIAKYFGVSNSCIWSIIKNKTWKV